MTWVNLDEFIIIFSSGLNKCQNLRIMDHVQPRGEFEAIIVHPPEKELHMYT